MLLGAQASSHKASAQVMVNWLAARLETKKQKQNYMYVFVSEMKTPQCNSRKADNADRR